MGEDPLTFTRDCTACRVMMYYVRLYPSFASVKET